MDSSDPDHQTDKSSPEMLSDSSSSVDYPDITDIFEDVLVHPRVGDEYQVEIPPILSESELLQLKTLPADSEGTADSSHSFLTGLPIPVIWVYNHASSMKNESLESENMAMNQSSSHQKEPKINVNAPNQTSLSNGYTVVPGLSTEAWTDFEIDCFLLGLYLFGKDLLQVKRFMESKDMGQILSYYYGQFRGSAGYRKWSECRKMTSRKCIVGHRFFTRYRQQEIFSRLLPHLTEESKTKLLEAYRAFAEGSASLDQYVSKLKSLVGIHALVEAAAIGKGKEDITTLVMDLKNAQMFTHRPDMPSGKAFSSLTCAEIVKYLTGDIRLSKARSNDLFWEAVWPRLLARGWHSEQPRVDVYAGSKNGLVFLMPEIKKFSRRKLTKGDHYFDSISDVLSKVANEPELLELEGDETKPRSSKAGNGWAVEGNSGYDLDPPDREHHCYLKPHVSAGLSNLTKFTVVDTSLASEGNPLKTRELRSLPLDAKRSSNPSNQLRKPETKIKGNADVLLNGIQSSDLSPSNDYKSRVTKHQSSRRTKPGQSNSTKRRKLGSCLEVNFAFVLGLPAQARNASTNKKVVPPKMNHQNVEVKELSTHSSLAATADGKILEEKMTEKKCSSSPENGTTSDLLKVIDLNLPRGLTKTKGDTNGLSEEVENNTNQHSDAEKTKQFNADIGPSDDTDDAHVTCMPVEPSNNDGGSDYQPRRQSTRSRPLTTKALEALEVQFLNPARHSRKRSPSRAQDQKQPKKPHQPQNKSFIFPDVMGFQEMACKTKTDSLGKPPIGTISTELSGFSKASCSPEAAA